MISQKLKIAIFLDHRNAYQIAQEAGVNPSTLSKLINGIQKVKPGDPRVVRVGQILRLKPDECFQSELENAQQSERD